MRRIAILNQKGGVGKTTTAANLGAALARLGRRVVVVDMDPQANLSLHLGLEPAPDVPSIYGVLMGQASFAAALRPTATDGLWLLPSHIDLSGAELELAGAIGRERILAEAVSEWVEAAGGAAPADYLLFDCAPSLGLLTINALTAVREVFVTLQTEFFALQGVSKLVEVIGLLQRRLNPELAITGILPCLYDSRLKLAREVLAEIKRYFPQEVFRRSIRTNVKLAEAPSYGQHIFDYAPESKGALDYTSLALEVLDQEPARDPELALLARPASEPTSAALAPLREGEPAKRLAQDVATEDEVGEEASQDAPAVPSRNFERRSAPPSRSIGRSWDSPEVGDVVLEPLPRPAVVAPATQRGPRASEELPPLPPDAHGINGRPRP